MRVAVYVRVSTQRPVQTQSLEQQLERLRVYIQSQGWELGPENVFRGEGYSGARLQRPGLDRLRDRVHEAAFDRVLLTTPDRLARNYVHQVLLLEELERYGCVLGFVDRPMSRDPHDQLLLQIRGAVAEHERTLITERMRRGRLQKLRAGVLLPWTVPPYGYRVDPERPRDPAGVRLDATEAAVVRELVAWALEAHGSLFGIAKQLQALGLRSPSGKARWNPSTIRGILTNPAYTGQVYAGRTRVRPARQRRSPLYVSGQKHRSEAPVPRAEWIPVATVPAVVSVNHFELVQTKLAQNKQFASRNNTAHPYLLRALVSCGGC